MKQFRPNKFNWWDAPVGTMPRVYYGGGKSQTSTSQVSIPPEVLAQYQNVNSIANQVAQTPFQQYSQDPNAFVAPLTTTQQAGILGTNEYSSEAQPFYQTASNETQAAAKQAATPGGLDSSIQSYMSPYNQNVINQESQLLQQQYNQAQSGQLGNAIQNGAFGGDRAAVTAANLQQQQGLAYGNTMAQLLNQNYSQALGTAQQQQGVALGAANQEANIGAGAQSAGLAGAQAQLTAGQAQQQTEQAGLTALYNQFLQQQSYPFQTTQFLANIAEGTGALSGSTTTSNQPSPYFSDERLKDDIEPIGKTFDGLNIIKFRYKGSKQPHIGLSAQEVEKTHPDAVGLAGGYKTVDYDAATRAAAHKAHDKSHAGGLVAPDGARRGYDVGGYAGLSPNSAWSGGFYLDPSYLQAQEAAYATAPWGNAGPVSGSAPYGGKSHVPPSMGGIHASLAVAKPPAEHNSSGLQQLSSGLGQLEKLGGQGKSLFNSVKGYLPSGLGGSSSPQPSATTGGSTSAGNAPPAPHQPPVTNDNAAPIPPSNDASSGPIAGLDPGDLGSPDLSDLDFGDGLAARRGGRIRHGLDAGGTPSFSQPTDSGQDDESDTGDVPYDSGTGAGGLDIPDDKSNNKLAVAQPPSNSGSGGGFNPLGLLGPVLGIFGLADGGRVGLAGGGTPDDMPLPDLPTSDNPEGLNLPDGIDTSWMSKPYGGHSTDYGPPKSVVTTDSGGTGLAPPAPQGRDITIHKATPVVYAPAVPPPRPKDEAPTAPKPQRSAPPAPKQATGGINPDVPSPDAQPVQAVQPQGHVTEPGEVLNQDNVGGIGDFLNRNQGLIVPFLHGLGTMASSNSRYLGSAILQGLGGAADSYENVQNEMQQRHGLQPIITERQAQAQSALLGNLAAFNAMNAGAIGRDLTLAEYQQYLNTGKLPQTGPGAGQSGRQTGQTGGPGDANGPFTFTPQERMTRRLSNGNMAYADPAYNRGYAAKQSGVGTMVPYVAGTVSDANHAAAEANAHGFTTNAQGTRTPVPGYQSTVIGQAQPEIQAQQAKDFQNERIGFLNDYQRSMSLFDELGDVYHQFQAGPTADWRGAVSALANDFDPTGQFPFLHNIPAGNDAENYAKARKDIAQLTASRLSTLPGGAPKAELGLLDQYAAEPNLPPGALRDIIIRGKAALQQTHDYYRGLNPFAPNAPSVPDYQAQFYDAHPYESYRKQLEKSTPAFAGQTAANSPELNGGVPQAPGASIPTVNSPDEARRLPPGTRFRSPDGKIRVVPNG